MDQTILSPPAPATSSSAQDTQADFDHDEVHPPQLSIGTMRHCFFYMCMEPAPSHGYCIGCRFTKENFVRPVHGVLFEKFREMRDLRLDVEIVHLIMALHKRGLLNRIGGVYVVITFYYFAYTVKSCEKVFSMPDHRNNLRRIVEEWANGSSNPLTYLGVGQGDPASQELELRDAVAEVLEHFVM